MLIRTQDQKGIINLDQVEAIFISEVSEKEFNIVANVNDGNYILGKYTPAHQAIYVLDTITSEYMKSTITGHGIRNLNTVYQMPEDWGETY